METYLNGLKNQVTSVGLSNKIHDLGITTPSVFYREWQGAKEGEIQTWNSEGKPEHCPDNVNCYTVAELVSLLTELKYNDIISLREISADFLANKLINHYEKLGKK